MAIDAKAQLFQALKAHVSKLEVERDVASDCDRETLGRRMGAARLLLDWLSEVLKSDSAVSPPAHKQPPPDLRLIRKKGSA
jgi:hypothetical protein